MQNNDNKDLSDDELFDFMYGRCVNNISIVNQNQWVRDIEGPHPVNKLSLDNGDDVNLDGDGTTGEILLSLLALRVRFM